MSNDMTSTSGDVWIGSQVRVIMVPLLLLQRNPLWAVSVAA